MKTLLKRTISGLIFVAIVVGCFVVGPLAVAGLFFIFSLLATLEFARLNFLDTLSVWFVGSGVLVYGLSASVYLEYLPFSSLMWAIPLVIVGAGIDVLSNKPAEIFTFMGGILYIPLSFSLLLLLTRMGNGYSYELPLGLVVLIWMNDTGAYLLGTWLGKHKMVPEVSPAKSWEGFFGGWIVALLAAVVLARLWTTVETIDWIVMAGMATVIGTLGDLFESKMKRAAGVKDSGSLMPGHGGVLDRFDALLFVLPCVLVYFFMVST